MDMKFKPIELKDKQIFDDFSKRYPHQGSDLTFTNLFCWRFKYSYEYAVVEEHLLISSSLHGRRVFYQPVGKDPAQIMAKVLEKYPDSEFTRVQKKVAEAMPDRFTVREQRDMFDYVYDVKELAELQGTRYAPKRNFVHQCEKYNPSTCILDRGGVKSFLDMQEKWCRMRGCGDDPELYAEDCAVREAITHAEELGIFGVCVEIDGKIEAFAIGERLNNDTFVEHFEKGNTDFSGIYQYLLREFAKAIPGEFRYLNREQDLGIEGLRKAKLSYHPARMVEKFTVTME